MSACKCEDLKPKKRKRLCSKECRDTVKDGLHTNNPVTCQVLGICSCLAVTNMVSSALVMSVALIFVLTMSNVLVSILRNLIPRRIRMVAEVAIIATFVILFDLFLKAFFWDMRDLDGLWRVVSFLGLGLSLLGIAYLFNKLKVVEKSAALPLT